MPFGRRGLLSRADSPRSIGVRAAIAAAAGAAAPEVTIGTTTVEWQNINASGTTAYTVPAHSLGDLLVLSMGMNKQDVSADEITIVTAGWVELAAAEKQTSTGSGYTQRLYTKIGDGIEATVLVNNDTVEGGYNVNIGITPFTSVHSDYWDVIPVAGHADEDQNSTNLQAVPITTTVDNSVVYLAGHVTDNHSTYGTPAGYTDDAHNNVAQGSQYICTKLVVSAGLETPGAWTCTGVSATADNLSMVLSIMPKQTDEFWDNVELLLTMAGVDGATTFNDLSKNTALQAVTPNASAQVDTAQYKFGGSSLLVDGQDDNIKVTLVNTFGNLDLGAGNFIIELDIRANTSAGADQIFEMGPVGNYHIALLMSNNNLFIEYSTTGSTYTQVDSGHDASDATWHHLALIRNGNDLDLYMDGVKGSTTADVTGLTMHALDSSAILYIGAANDSSAGFDGNIDNFRYTKGEARYTENFTAPTHAYPITAATDDDFSSVVLLLNFAGDDAATNITDLSNSAHDETFFSAAQIEIANTFLGENSLLLDGAIDRVVYADHADWDLSADFTIELGINTDSTGVSQTCISNYDGSIGWWVQYLTGSPAKLRFGWGASVLYEEDWTPFSADTWYHVAISRSSTNLRVFVNGIQLGATVTDSTDMSASTGALTLGTLDGAQYWDGNLGAVRITKGIARYTDDFPPLADFYPTS